MKLSSFFSSLLLLSIADYAVSSPLEGLTFQLYDNAALTGSYSFKGTTPSVKLSLQNDDKKSCYLSGELLGTIRFPFSGKWRFDCDFHHTSTGWVWIDGHLVCGDGNPYNPPGETDNPIPVKDTIVYPFRAHITTNSTTSCEQQIPSLNVGFYYEGKSDNKMDSPEVQQRFRSLRQNQAGTQEWQGAMEGELILTPNLPAVEAKRDEFQRRLSTGWGSWLRVNLLSIVKLPEGLVITPFLCRRSTMECLTKAVPDDNTARVDLHAYDRSYVGFNITFQGVAASIEYAVSGGDQLQALVSILECPNQDCKDFFIMIQARYAWFRPGTVSFLPDTQLGFSYQTPGLGSLNVTILSDTQAENADKENLFIPPGFDSDSYFLRAPLGKTSTKVGLLANVQSSGVQEIENTLQANKAAELDRIRAKFGPKAAVAEAIQCAVMWTLIYNPVENNGPFMPVSRSESWSFLGRSGVATADWTYVIFDWDNLFASLLAGLDNKDIAYSNLFQVVKSKAAGGQIPNWSTGGAKSQDRTEPPVGAKVVLELFRKYKETWPVEVVFDDLLDWNNWFVANRVLEPAGLIALGSHYEPPDINMPYPLNGEQWNTMQAARWESGLDNSPMYDGKFFDNNVTHMMQMYDVGMSSMFTQEAYSLAELADAIGRDPKVGQMLRSRADAMAKKIATHLWDSQQGIFANLFTNGTFTQHITPTSFYPLAIGAGDEEQIDHMLKSWMLNSTRFCISPEGDFDGNDPDLCYWGLPSVSADDPTYLKGNFVYWRGYTWGPMAQLVWWSLKDSGQGDIVAKARKALSKQMGALMMSRWSTNRHICENYNPHRNASECSGTRFYHWGALNGLIGMVEDGFW